MDDFTARVHEKSNSTETPTPGRGQPSCRAHILAPSGRGRPVGQRTSRVRRLSENERFRGRSGLGSSAFFFAGITALPRNDPLGARRAGGARKRQFAAAAQGCDRTSGAAVLSDDVIVVY